MAVGEEWWWVVRGKGVRALVRSRSSRRRPVARSEAGREGWRDRTPFEWVVFRLVLRFDAGPYTYLVVSRATSSCHVVYFS
jgi:hypothetical protein